MRDMNLVPMDMKNLALDLLMNPEFFNDEDPQVINMMPAMILLFPRAEITSENTMKIEFFKRFFPLYMKHKEEFRHYIISKDWIYYFDELEDNAENLRVLVEPIPSRPHMKVGNIYQIMPYSEWVDSDGDKYASYRSLDGQYSGQYKACHFKRLFEDEDMG